MNAVLTMTVYNSLWSSVLFLSTYHTTADFTVGNSMAGEYTL